MKKNLCIFKILAFGILLILESNSFGNKKLFFQGLINKSSKPIKLILGQSSKPALSAKIEPHKAQLFYQTIEKYDGKVEPKITIKKHTIGRPRIIIPSGLNTRFLLEIDDSNNNVNEIGLEYNN